MRIQGSLKEFSFLLHLAKKMNGEFLYFLPEGDTWMLYNGGKATYFKSHLDISHSVVIGWSSLQNLKNLIDRTKKQRRGKGSFREWSEDFFRLEEGAIQFGESGTYRAEVNSGMERVREFSQFAAHFGHLREAIEVEDAPYIKLETSMIRKYEREVFHHHKDHGHGVLVKTEANLLDEKMRNILMLDDNEDLAIVHETAMFSGVPPKKFVYTEGFFIPEKYWDYAFYLTDASIHLMLMLAENESIDEFRVLLYKNYYVIDAYDSELLFRMWTRRKKR